MSGRLKIAVADDEADTREYLQECLSRLGHEVRAAEGGGSWSSCAAPSAPTW